MPDRSPDDVWADRSLGHIIIQRYPMVLQESPISSDPFTWSRRIGGRRGFWLLTASRRLAAAEKAFGAMLIARAIIAVVGTAMLVL